MFTSKPASVNINLSLNKLEQKFASQMAWLGKLRNAVLRIKLRLQRENSPEILMRSTISDQHWLLKAMYIKLSSLQSWEIYFPIQISYPFKSTMKQRVNNS